MIVQVRHITGSLVVATLIVCYYIVAQYTFQSLTVYEPTMAPTTESSHAFPLFRVETDRPRVFLTFDVSWGDTVVLEAARSLVDVRARGTFFVSASWAHTHRDTVRELLRLGHDVASLGTTKRDYRQLNEQDIEKELLAAREELAGVPGTLSWLMRTPRGTYSPTVIAVAARFGYTVVLWDIDPWDWKLEQPGQVCDRVIGAVRSGSIVRFAADDSYPQLPKILPLLTQELRKEGFAVLPLRVLSYDQSSR